MAKVYENGLIKVGVDIEAGIVSIEYKGKAISVLVYPVERNGPKSLMVVPGSHSEMVVDTEEHGAPAIRVFTKLHTAKTEATR